MPRQVRYLWPVPYKCQAAVDQNINGAFSYELNQSAYEDKELDAYQRRSGGTMVQID